jgi:hypothetical protein
LKAATNIKSGSQFKKCKGDLSKFFKEGDMIVNIKADNRVNSAMLEAMTAKIIFCIF